MSIDLVIIVTVSAGRISVGATTPDAIAALGWLSMAMRSVEQTGVDYRIGEADNHGEGAAINSPPSAQVNDGTT